MSDAHRVAEQLRRLAGRLNGHGWMIRVWRGAGGQCEEQRPRQTSFRTIRVFMIPGTGTIHTSKQIRNASKNDPRNGDGLRKDTEGPGKGWGGCESSAW